jgi:hypothetical protein
MSILQQLSIYRPFALGPGAELMNSSAGQMKVHAAAVSIDFAFFPVNFE